MPQNKMSAYTHPTIPIMRMYAGYQGFITVFENGHFCMNLLLPKYRLRAQAATLPGWAMHSVLNKATAVATTERIGMGI